MDRRTRDSAGTPGYGAGEPHASLGQYHDRESFVAACAATFGAPGGAPAPASQRQEPGDLASEIAAMLEGGEDDATCHGRAAGAAGAAAALDLIERHNSKEDPTSPRILVKTESYPTGARRVLIRELPAELDPVIVAGTPQRTKRDKSEQERVESSIARTRKTIRQKCMAFKCDRLLTLTYRENMTDRDRAYRDTVLFIQRCRTAKLLPKYVAVAEQQKRGAWHVHIACRGFMSVLTLRRIWRGIVGADNGNIDLSYRNRGQANPWRIAGYLSKYIGKAIAQSAAGDRTFWASEWGGQEPIERVRLMPPGATLTQVKLAVLWLLHDRRANGGFQVVDEWGPKKKGADPPGVFVFWAA